MFLALLHPFVLGAALRVQGDMSCPAPDDVSANVQAIVDLSPESAANVYATLRREGEWLELELSDGKGRTLGTRRVGASEDCAVLARAAAVVLASWLSEEHPEFLVTLQNSPSGDANGRERAPTEGTSPAAVPPPAQPSLPPPLPVAPRAAPVRPAVPAGRVARRRVELGASIGGDVSGSSDSQFAPAAGVSAAWAPRASGLGARLGATWIGARSLTIQDASHEVRWTRWPLLLGAFYRLERGRMSFDLEAGPAFGWLHAGGRNFSTNSSDDRAIVGGYAALRWVPRNEGLRAFVSVAPVYWFGKTTARATVASTGTESTRDIPSFELSIAAGLQLPL